MWGTVHKTFYENVSKSIFGNVSVTETFQKHFPKMFLKQKRTRNVPETFPEHVPGTSCSFVVPETFLKSKTKMFLINCCVVVTVPYPLKLVL